MPLLGLSLAFEGPRAIGDAFGAVDLGGLAALAYIVGPSTLFGFAAWTSLVRRYPAAVVAPFTLLVPVFGIAAAALTLGERPSAAELVGARRGDRRPALRPRAPSSEPARVRQRRAGARELIDLDADLAERRHLDAAQARDRVGVGALHRRSAAPATA